MNSNNNKANPNIGNNNFKRKLASAKTSRHTHHLNTHTIKGSCSACDLFANWDDECLLHLIHDTELNNNNKNEKFPSTSQPIMFTGCLLEKDKQEIIPMSIKMSFEEDKMTKPGMLKVSGDGMIYFDHFQVHGWVTKAKNIHSEHLIDLVVEKADEVGG